MYDLENWEGCLSLMQLSVALNLGSILVENKIKKLFDSDEKQDNSCKEECLGTIEEYQKVYCGKMQDCIQKVGELNKMHGELNKLTSVYFKALDEFQILNVCKRLDAICFNYACFLLGIYGLLCLYIIPLARNSFMATSFIVSFSLFALVAIFVLLIIEIMHRIKKEGIIKWFFKKNFMYEIFIILLFIILSIGLALINTKYLLWGNSDASMQIICNLSVILPYASFIICFILLFIDNRRYKKKSRLIRDYKKEFIGLYIKIMDEKK